MSKYTGIFKKIIPDYTIRVMGCDRPGHDVPDRAQA
jgi:hypothetical protein